MYKQLALHRWTSLSPLNGSIDQNQFVGQLQGSYIVRDILGGGTQQVCHTRSISTTLLTIDCAAPGQAGAKWSAYFPEFGILRGVVLRLDGPRTAVLELALSEDTARRLGATLRWMMRRKMGLARDQRRAPRLSPRYPHADLQQGEADKAEAVLIDISVTGARLTSDLPLELGSHVMLGTVAAKVVRKTRRIFGVEFLEPLADKNFEQTLYRIDKIG